MLTQAEIENLSPAVFHAHVLAWFKICEAANAVDENWMLYGPTGPDAIIALLSQLEIAPFQVGQTYKMVGGGEVTLIGVSNEGTRYETMHCADDVHRYTRRDFGRVTGSSFDHDDPRCLIPKYRVKQA